MGVMSPTISRRRALTAAAAAGLGLPAGAAHAAASGPAPVIQPGVGPAGRGRSTNVRFATFNASLNRAVEGGLLADLETGQDPQIRAVAEVIQINNPDVLLINEFDYDAEHRAIDLFRRNYLEVGQNGRTPVHYHYVHTAPVNTGVPSGLDLNRDGTASRISLSGLDAQDVTAYVAEAGYDDDERARLRAAAIT